MADEVLAGPAMVGQLLRECQRVTHHTGDALPQGVVEALNVVGFPGFLRDGVVLRRRTHPCVGFILIRIECRQLPVHGGQVSPQLLRTVATAIAEVQGNEWPRLLGPGDPGPWRVGLLLHEAPHLIRFNLKTPNDHLTWGCNRLHMQMIRQCLQAGAQKVHEPSDTDTNGATDAVQRDFLAQQAFPQSTLVLSTRTGFGVHHKLATTRLALVVNRLELRHSGRDLLRFLQGRGDTNIAILISLALSYQNKEMGISSGQRDEASVEQFNAALAATADIADALTAAIRMKLNPSDA